MNPILSAGVLIGVLCGIWSFVFGFAGWYKDPATAALFFLVVPIEIGGLIWGLRRTAAQGRNYGGQIVAGTMMAIVAGVIIVCASLLFTTVVFPDYFAEIERATRASLQAQGKSDAEILAAVQSNATPMAQAMGGFIGTLVTGIVASAVIAVFVRARPQPART